MKRILKKQMKSNQKKKFEKKLTPEAMSYK